MTLRVIEGGRTPIGAENADAVTGPDHVRNEGGRRLSEAGYERFVARERLTGIPMPSAIRYFGLQVEFAIAALSKLNLTPADVRSDGYWPVLEPEDSAATC